MRAIGMILAGGSSRRIRELTKHRAVAALPIAGNFRSIDFALSSMTNSHVQKVAVFTQYNARSLTEHLSSSKWWDFGRKQGGLTIFTPSITDDNNLWFRGTADAMYQNLSFLKNSHEPYVIIASGDCIYKVDYAKVLEYHIEKKADITVVVKDLPDGFKAERYGCVKLDPDGRIIDFEQKPVIASTNTVSCGIYILRRRQLIEFIEKCAEEDRHDFVSDILVRYRDVKSIYGYRLDSYWSNIASLDDYYRTNMDFLKHEVRTFFLRDYPVIYTKADDLPPVKLNVGSNVRNSLIATGSIINGSVEDSLLFKKVFVGSNCSIKNCIILDDVYIADNSHIENCIVESHSTLKAGYQHMGGSDIDVVSEKGDRYIL
ncbi:MAG: glucose-1-phosphate adenylyltransferase subunit GlgD [Lachnospiraceae bacterium]|nr:glucose-1-phosphate adenylyltransferase subunit GlgD [Lachnospiraceae bacterium]